MSCCKLFSNMSWTNFQNIWELLSSHKQRFLDKGKSNSWQSYAKKMFLKFLKNILLWNVLKINIAIKSKHQISYENSDVPSQLSSQLFWGNSCTCTGYILCAQVQSQCGNNQEGTLSSWLHIYYYYLGFVRFEHFVCRGSLATTYIYKFDISSFSIQTIWTHYLR